MTTYYFCQCLFFFSSRRRHTRLVSDWSSDVCSSDLPTELAGPVLFLPGTTPLDLGGEYRGQIEVGVTGTRLAAINIVGVEQYLAGVVAREMPSDWPDEALRAQAVAARSYAFANRAAGKPFDLYADVRSQVYGGVAAE